MYQVLARKWRPQTFDELVGQQHVARALRNAVESGRLAHAYIFAGVRGIGKTTVARIFAKCLNCESGPTTTPCNQCTPCKEITESRSLDVLEMDAASRRGIDSIRELQEVVSYAPVRDRYKIFILDEFHMLTKEAFNALLKTLEEPPPRVLFVLATTEIQKILPTILSRCQVFDFRRVTAGEAGAHLRRICDTEKVRISDESLERIARAGEGSVRDSLSILERVLAFCGSEVSDEEALHVLGAVRTEVLIEMIRSLASRDASGMLSALDGLIEEGHDLLHFWSELVTALRDLLLLRTVPDRESLVSRPTEEIAALREAAEGLSRDDLLRAFQILADLEFGLKASGQPRFLFEAALLRLAALGAVRPIEEVIASMGAGARPGAVASSKPAGERDDTAGTAERPRPVASAPKKKERPGSDLTGPTGAPVGDEKPSGPVPDFLAAVCDAKPMLGAMLEQAATVRLEANTLVIRMGPESGTLGKRLGDEDSQLVLLRAAEATLGKAVEVRIDGGGKKGGRPAPARRPSTGKRLEGDPPPNAPRRRGATGSPGTRHESLLENAKKDPGVKKLLHEFGAQVVDIRPLETPRDLVGDDAETEPTEESE